jgi:mannose-6-phosphate isomerase-like protein (cupin superfamily)
MATTKAPNVRPKVRVSRQVGPARVVKLSDQEEFRSTCGMRRDLVDVGTDEPLWFHYLRVSDSRKHFHARTTEYYFVVAGPGEMELDDDTVPIEAGDMIVVPPGVRHTTRPTTDADLEILIVVRPPSGAAAHEEHYD